MFDAGTILAQTGDGGWLLFQNPWRTLIAYGRSDVAPVLASVDQALAEGLHVAGVLAYEAACGVDAALEAKPAPADQPLVWFGVYRDFTRLDEMPLPSAGGEDLVSGAWEADTDRDEYRRALERIRAYIAAGDTYQVNYTLRLRQAFRGDAYALFARLQQAQQSKNCVYADLGDLAICSASPELFFETVGDEVIARPMKGTARRALTSAADRRRASELAVCPKNRSENVMIVDMIRNDLGRIAVAGTVRAAPLFVVERYPTVHQMVSTVRAKIRPGTSFSDRVGALFPCASITGAPKVRAMQIIAELESAPRGYYTGMAGYNLADGTSRFNVMIRTVTVDRLKGQAEFGTGGGIVWDSVEDLEYDECLAKSAVLHYSPVCFALLETLRYDSATGFAYLAEHIERAAGSAAYFGYPFDAERMQRALQDAVQVAGGGVRRVRWLLGADGVMRVEVQPLVALREEDPVGLAGSGSAQRENVFFYHKTTHRGGYDRVLAQFAGCRDVILVNDRGEVTESCLANVVVEIAGEKRTPPVSCGLLDGTLRRRLVREGAIREIVVPVADLLAADRAWLVNSVRGWMPLNLAELVNGDAVRT